MPTSIAIDWAGARVAGGSLSVEVAPAPDRRWKQRFKRIVAMLDRAGGDWGEIELHGSTITVRDVHEGGEERLRHLLESVVVEIVGDPDAPTVAVRGDDDEPRARDRRLTEAFRAFGE